MNLIKDKHNGEPKIWWHNGGADEAIDARIEDGDGLIFTEENELKIAMFDAATSAWIGNGAATEIEKPDDPLIVGEYFVKFYVNKELYETVKTLGGHTINEPEDPEAPEGYTFKQWLLNGETFDFSTVITSDITLIAEFEEAEEEVVWEDNVTFTTDTETGMLISEIDYETVLDLTANYTFTCGGETIRGKFTEVDDYYILGTISEEGVEGAVLGYFPGGATPGSSQLSFIYADSTFDTETTYHAKLVKSEAPEPSGIYTWNGVASGDDITVIQPGDPGMPVTFHKVSNDKYTRSDIVNQTVKITCIDSDDDITVLSGNNIVPSSDDPSYTFIMLPLPLLLFSGEADIGPLLEIEEEIYLNGTYMISTTDFDSAEPFTIYCKELRIEVPVEGVIWEDDVTFVEGGGHMTAVATQIGELSINTTDTYTFTCGEQTINGKFYISEGAYMLGEMDSFGVAYMSDYADGYIQIVGTTEMFDTETTYHAKLVKSETPVEDVVWEDTLEFSGSDGMISYTSTEAFPELDKLNTTDTFTISINDLSLSHTGTFELVDGGYSLGNEESGIMFGASAEHPYSVMALGEAGTYTVKLTKSEAPAPSAE